MTKTAKRSCAYCGGFPLTKEHAWPSWLDQFDLNPESTEGSAFVVIDGREQFRGHRKTISGGLIKHFCKTCNTGWMSDIEGNAKPFLGPLIQGRGMPMSGLAQRAVATWLLNRCLVLGVTDEESRWRERSQEYAEFLRSKLPGKHHLISIAGCATDLSTSFRHRGFTRLLEYDDGTSVRQNGYLATVTVGHFVGQVLYVPAERDHIAPRRLRTVWPVGGEFIWPTGILCGAEVEFIASNPFDT